MRFVTKSMHAYLDYPVAVALLALPFLSGLGGSHPLALIAAPIAGAAALTLTIFTDHHLGVVGVLPYRFHLAVDLAVGIVFLLLPSTFGFAGLDAAFYWLTGAAVVAVRVAANRPAVLRALLSASDSLSGGGFDARTREAIALAVAGRNACDYCASAHSAIAAGLKIEAEAIAQHLAGRAADERLQAILSLSVAIVDARGRVADSDLDSARAAGLSDADIVDTVGNVVVNIFTNYLNHVADTDIDFPVVTVGKAAA